MSEWPSNSVCILGWSGLQCASSSSKDKLLARICRSSRSELSLVKLARNSLASTLICFSSRWITTWRLQPSCLVGLRLSWKFGLLSSRKETLGCIPNTNFPPPPFPLEDQIWIFTRLRKTRMRCTMVDNSQEYRLQYWPTRLSVRSYRSLVGQWMIGYFICVFFHFRP